ncbi:MAG: RNA-binding S4 domain-containing protein [Pseudomonadota bacterium]
MTAGPATPPPADDGRQRIDKWLWHGRFFKTRSLAARMVSEGRVRLNADKVTKASQPVGAGDTLTFPQGDLIRVVEVMATLPRRGPAPEAQAAYRDHTPPPAPRVGARPTGRDRRRLDAAKDRSDP